MKKLGARSALACFAFLCPAFAEAGLVVFTNTFDGALPPEIHPGVGTNTAVQGYAGLGSPGNEFAGAFLRSPTGNTITLTLTNLPPHSTLSLTMLFAAIDSLDGTGSFPSGDFFRVTLGDGQTSTVVFRESFANATSSQVQSYTPPPGGELARRVDLGFSGPGSYYTDSAYNFGIDSRFRNLAHTGDVAVLTFLMEGPGIQSLGDESWAMDNLGITLDDSPDAEAPVITHIHVANNLALLLWSATPARAYQLQSCADLLTREWVDRGPVITATNSEAWHAEPFTPESRFYRVKLLEP